MAARDGAVQQLSSELHYLRAAQHSGEAGSRTGPGTGDGPTRADGGSDGDEVAVNIVHVRRPPQPVGAERRPQAVWRDPSALISWL